MARAFFRWSASVLAAISAIATSGCGIPAQESRIPAVNTAPASQPFSGEAIALDRSAIKPMYRELLPIDLPAAFRVAAARNLDILQAREQVIASRGQYEASIGNALPALVPTAFFEHVEGTVRATEGSLVGVDLNTFTPSVAIQWITNPGRVVYQIVAARKRLAAAGHQEEAVSLETLHLTGEQYYELALAQARIRTANQALAEAEELLRTTRLRAKNGTGLPADEMRAEARVAEKQQELSIALNAFYNASVSLAVTLRLDATVTLIPDTISIQPTRLVREDLDIETLLGIAAARRPDLAAVRDLLEAARADKNALIWDNLGPAFQVGYQYGGITGHANNVIPAQGMPNNLIVNPASAGGSFNGNPVVNGLIRESISRGSLRLAHRRDQTFGFSDQQRASAQAGWRFSFAAFGQFKTASSAQRQAVLQMDATMDRVAAEVVRAEQASTMNEQLITLAQRQVAAAEESVRLSQTNFKVGTMTTLDVLQAQDAAEQAQLRYAEAVVRYNQTQIALLASIGMIGERL